MIIGGSDVGCEVARVLAIRGHKQESELITFCMAILTGICILACCMPAAASSRNVTKKHIRWNWGRAFS